jgi:hypothetical protein
MLATVTKIQASYDHEEIATLRDFVVPEPAVHPGSFDAGV